MWNGRKGGGLACARIDASGSLMMDARNGATGPDGRRMDLELFLEHWDLKH